VDEHQLAVALTFDFEYNSSQFAADRPYRIEENGKRTNLVEISKAVLFLLSEDASFVTGVALPVDGGYLLKGWP